MIRLHIITEGQTEQNFVKSVLQEHLAGFNVFVNDRRFIPYIQLHEFETLIFSDPQMLNREYLEHDIPIENLKAMAEGQNPELINDGSTTAPSKRIIAEIPEYDKATAGVEVVAACTLVMLRTNQF